MPAKTPPVPDTAREQVARLGASLRAARETQGVTATSASEAAGISRVTLHRIERGEGNVAIASWASVAAALGMDLHASPASGTTRKAAALPKSIALDKFPQLRQLAWQLGKVKRLSPKQALDLYERNWRHIDRKQLSPEESELVRALAEQLSGGKLLV